MSSPIKSRNHPVSSFKDAIFSKYDNTRSKEDDQQDGTIRIQRETHDRNLARTEEDKKAKNESSLLERLVKTGMSAVATNMMIGIVAEGVTTTDLPTDQTALDKAPNMEGEVIAGPEQGGGFLDRPIGGALADSSLQQSLDVQYGQEGSVKTAEGAGTLTANGNDIQVTEYLPGNELTKIATGEELNAGDGIGLAIERGIEQHKEDVARGAVAHVVNRTIQSKTAKTGSGDDSTASATGDGTGSTGEEKLTERSVAEDGFIVNTGGRAGADDILTASDVSERRRSGLHVDRETLDIEAKADLAESQRTKSPPVEATAQNTDDIASFTSKPVSKPASDPESKSQELAVKTDAKPDLDNGTSKQMSDLQMRAIMAEKEADSGMTPYKKLF